MDGQYGNGMGSQNQPRGETEYLCAGKFTLTLSISYHFADFLYRLWCEKRDTVEGAYPL
jgi:hypothetical protein